MTGWKQKKLFQVSLDLCVGLIMLLCFVFVADCFAAGGHGEGHVPSITDTFRFWPNFIVFVVVLGYILRKPLLAFWEQRVEQISRAVNAGKEAEKAAEDRLESARERYAKVDDEVKALREKIREEGKAEAARIMTEGKARAQSIGARAEEGLSAEKANLESRLREELAGRVVARAEEIVRGKVDGELDQKLRNGVFGGVRNLLQ